MDLFMAFRELTYLALGIPALFYGVKVITKLGDAEVSSSRVFLRSGMFLGFLRGILLFTLLGVVTAILLYMWWITNLEEFRVSGGLASIGALGFLLFSIRELNALLEA